jgi:hypothetical protein
MSKRILGLVSLVTVLSMAAPVLADEVSATRSTTLETPAGTAKATHSTKVKSDGLGATTENATKVEQASPLGGYRSDSVKSTQSTDGLGTTEKSTSAKTTVAP